MGYTFRLISLKWSIDLARLVWNVVYNSPDLFWDGVYISLLFVKTQNFENNDVIMTSYNYLRKTSLVWAVSCQIYLLVEVLWPPPPLLPSLRAPKKPSLIMNRVKIWLKAAQPHQKHGRVHPLFGKCPSAGLASIWTTVMMNSSWPNASTGRSLESALEFCPHPLPSAYIDIAFSISCLFFTKWRKLDTQRWAIADVGHIMVIDSNW